MKPHSDTIKKAMLLAAGFGVRLKPLTDSIPKPLIPISGKSVIEYNIELLKNAGVNEIVINLHHLGKSIKEYIGSGRKFGVKVTYSEEPKILGTGGGIKKAAKYFKDGPFFVVNSDVLINLDLNKISAYHFKKSGAATMVVRKMAVGENYAKLDIVPGGKLRGFGNGRYMFTGVQVLDPIIFKYLKTPSCLIESGYKQLLSHKLAVYAYIHHGYWNDIGTPERLKAAMKRFDRLTR